MEQREIMTTEKHMDLQGLEPMDDQAGEAGQEEQSREETPLGVPFGWFGITLLLNILQYTVLLGLTMVVLIIIRVFMPASMLNP